MIPEAALVTVLLRARLRVWHLVCITSPGTPGGVLPQGPLCPHLTRGNISNTGSSPQQTDDSLQKSRFACSLKRARN